MSNSIEVSPKHGVNPTIPVCFFCGEDKNMIALLGRVRRKDKNGRTIRNSDEEVPMRMVMDYEPCEKCAEHMSHGVTLIGVTTHQPSDCRPALTAQGGTQVFPSGAWCVMTSEAANRCFNIDKDFTDGDKLFVEHEVLVQMTQNAE